MSAYPAPAPLMVTRPPVRRAPRDGRGIAALVTGLLGTGPLAIALGASAIRTRRRVHGLNSGMGVAGVVLGSIQTVLYLLIAAVVVAAMASANTERAELRADCASGTLSACDDLASTVSANSDDLVFASTCGGRQSSGSGGLCAELYTANAIPLDYGDDATLDALYDDCKNGNLNSCDDLYAQSPSNSAYLEFGASCGNRGNDSRWCVNDRGDDATLDALYDACEEGDWEACDTLYQSSRAGSGYEEFGKTCGDRTDGSTWCTQTPGLDPNT